MYLFFYLALDLFRVFAFAQRMAERQVTRHKVFLWVIQCFKDVFCFAFEGDSERAAKFFGGGGEHDVLYTAPDGSEAVKRA